MTVTNDIRYVGVNDHKIDLFEGQYIVPVPKSGCYKAVFSSDEKAFGGWDRIDTSYVYRAERGADGRYSVTLYLPSRCALCLCPLKKRAASE